MVRELIFYVATGAFLFKPEFDSQPLRVIAVELFKLASAVDRLVCKRCGIRMMFARIAPDGPDFEVRSFECPKCDLVYIERVPTDPIVQRVVIKRTKAA